MVVVYFLCSGEEFDIYFKPLFVFVYIIQELPIFFTIKGIHSEIYFILSTSYFHVPYT